MRPVFDHCRARVDDPAGLTGVGAIGMDEAAFLRAKRHRHTSLVDTASVPLFAIRTRLGVI